MKIKLVLFICLSFGFLLTNIFGITVTTTLNTTAPPADPAYIANTDTQTGRLTRNGLASSCGSVKTNPGNITTTGDRQFDQYRFIALNSGCVIVTLRDAGDNLLFSSTYNQNGINTSDPSMNYLADIGSSPNSTTPSKSYSFDVVAGQIFNVVVHEVNAGGGIGQSYTLDVAGVKLEPDFSITETLDINAPQLHPAYISQTGTQTGRLDRNVVPSSCASPKANPGLATSTGTRRRDLFRFTPFASGCATVSLSHSGSNQAHIVVYNQNGFDPNSPSANYLADSGSSSSNASRVFSFIVQRGVPFDIVVHEVNPGAGIGDMYTLNISGVKLAPIVTINSKLDTFAPSTSPDFTASSGDQTGRLTRNTVPSTCNAPKPNPGLFSASGVRKYDLYTFTPADSGCVQVNLRNNSNGLLFSVAYNNSGFNPANPSLNYLADMGSSPVLNTTERSYSFSVTAGVPFNIVVHETNPAGGIGQDYTLEVSGLAINATRHVVPFDFDGDCKTDVGIFRPGPGEWWYLRSLDLGNRAYQFGLGTDKIVPADFTGDGVMDIAFWRPSTGFWFVLRSEDNSFFSFPFGITNDIPVPGDYDGDGIADPAIYRPSNSTWFILKSGGGTTIQQFGLNGDVPIPRDFDGDTKTDLAVFRPTLSQWFFENSGDKVVKGFQFGSFGDVPIPADFTGDGKADIAFFRPSNEWFILRSEDNSFFAFTYGIGGDKPVPGDYDGDGTEDVAVFRPSNNTWYLQQSTSGFTAIPFGITNDIPIPAAYIP